MPRKEESAAADRIMKEVRRNLVLAFRGRRSDELPTVKIILGAGSPNALESMRDADVMLDTFTKQAYDQVCQMVDAEIAAEKNREGLWIFSSFNKPWFGVRVERFEAHTVFNIERLYSLKEAV